MRFLKGHGTGNDFVLLPDLDGRLTLTPKLVAALCDRRRGIGADGVLRVARFDGDGAEFFMDYWNADGSLAEMCGNGARVFARYLVTAGLAAGTIPFMTRAGIVRAVVEDDAISVDMTPPKVYGVSTATLAHLTLAGAAVDVGNPHLVCALPASVPLESLDLSRAPEFDTDFFPAGVNVEFVTPVAERHVRMRVYERGSAETMSCGTGACAVAAVALRDAGLDDGPVTVDVPGGRVIVSFDGGECWLRGPAVLVAEGDVDLEAVGA
ncbi:diaminopimelate epimerase [Micromonospora sp. CPCC 206061]|uniref:diaminopimelate epimerase n=1 Tax=Micromonospora sp. CPCC 206061 TaxID=3122410 RepID=UPI002FEFB788